MSSCSSSNCEFLAPSFKKLMDEIKNSDSRRFCPKRSLSQFYIGKVQMLVEIALNLPISSVQVDEIVRSISHSLQQTGGIELLVPLAARKGSPAVREFLYEVLLEPKTEFPIFHKELILHLENLVGGKLKKCDLDRVRRAGIGDPNCLNIYEVQMF